MATVQGGVTGRPAGKLAGLVFGAARSRSGKIVTAREKVSPSNPNSAAQQEQRSKFSEALEIVRALSADVWQEDWNRGIGQLPGFQTMMSIFIDAQTAAFLLELPPPTPLGQLHYPDTLTAAGGGQSGTIDLEWTAETGGNGTGADTAKGIAIPTAAADRTPATIKAFAALDTRDDLGSQMTGLVPNKQHLVGVWFNGAGTAAGLRSPAKWFLATATV